MSQSALVLVEPGAHQAGGHRHHTLIALAAAHGDALIVAPYGVTEESAIALEKAGALVTSPSGRWPRLLARAAHAADVAARAGRRAFASPRWPRALRRAPHQMTLLARCLVEAACVRTAHREKSGAAVVVLTASEALHGAVGLLGGPHVRFVHEVVTTEDLVVRILGAGARRGRRHVVVLAPTGAVQEELAGRFPGLRVAVRPFAVADPAERLTATDRVQARAAFGIEATEAAVCLVGGWWPYKDIDVVDQALGWLDTRLHVIVVGAPLDRDVLKRWAGLPAVRLHVVPGPASAEQVRAVYAAADAALVTRRPGVGKESGLVVDAVRLGVPLLLSDHDPGLTARLAGLDWVRSFPTGDGARLAALLSDLAWAPLPRPCESTAAELGVPTAAEQIDFLTRIVNQPRELC